MATMLTEMGKLAKETYAAFNAHDLEKFLSLHTDDVVVENVAEGVIAHGKDEVRAYIGGYFTGFSNFKMDLISGFASGNQQCEECLVTGVHTGPFHGIPATGKSFSLRTILVRELRGGATCRIRQYYDSAAVMRQIGVVTPLAEAAPVTELRAANEQFVKALNALDAASMASMVHPEAVNFLRDSAFPGEVPKGVSEETFRAVIKSTLDQYESMQETPVNLQFRVVGNTGIVWGYTSVVAKPKGGRVQTRQSRITTTWVKSGGKWLVLCAHLSAIPSGD